GPAPALERTWLLRRSGCRQALPRGWHGRCAPGVRRLRVAGGPGTRHAQQLDLPSVGTGAMHTAGLVPPRQSSPGVLMAYNSNPFLERMSERTTSDMEFVRLFSPRILEKLADDSFEGAVHVFRSAPGA